MSRATCRLALRPETSVVSAPTVLVLASLFSDPLKSNNDRHLARHRSEAITARCGAFVWKRNGQSERRSSRVNTSVRRYMSFLQLNRVPKKMFAIVTSTFPNVLAQRPSSSFIIADVNLNLPAPVVHSLPETIVSSIYFGSDFDQYWIVLSRPVLRLCLLASEQYHTLLPPHKNNVV